MTLHVTIGAQRYLIQRPWGELPAGPGRVSDVGVDAQGHIYVLLRADSYEDLPAPTVVVLDAQGMQIGLFGEGVSDGHMLATAPDGSIHVVDRDAHEITRFRSDGLKLGAVGKRHFAGEPFNSPCDVCFAPDGTMYVGDGYAASRIHRFRPDGTPDGGWGEPGRGPGQFCTPHAVWLNAAGELAVCDRDNSRVQIFSADGAFLREITDVFKPMDVVSDAAGNWWVTDQVPRLSVFSREGALVGRARAVLNGAHGMALHPDGGVLLAEMNPSRLTRLAPV
ncbi:peptidase [Roseococcus sp. YIM B11640]|uniref:peptidase n=1 Tax=Roseococcus sp. YIM B11640 TaxID=3133973 RepID=UPI003C7BCE0D